MKNLILILSIGLFLFTSCSQENKSSGENNAIKVGSKDITEGLIVSEVYALALEKVGLKVQRVQNISGTLAHGAIKSAEVDIYPEYTGTALLSTLQMPLNTDPDEVYSIVKDEFLKRFNIVWLARSEINDSQGLAMDAKLAEQLGIKTLSDLQKHAGKLCLATQGEFNLREDGLPLLNKVYGEFKWKSISIYDKGLRHAIIKSNEVDVIPVYTTEGELVDKNKYLVLEDDKHVWPPYNLAPIVRGEVLKQHPEIEEILNNISSKLNNEVIIKLNAAVDIDKREYQDVAREFFNNI